LFRPRKTVNLLAAILAAGAGLFVLLVSGPGQSNRVIEDKKGDPQRGGYVARLAGCIACHTDFKSKKGFLAGGKSINTPFGVFQAPNITPHKEDGIGRWSLKEFSRAVTEGVSPDGDHYYPVFLYPNYSRMTDQDISDLWAAMKTVQPVAGKSPDHNLGFPFNIRAALGLWKMLFFKSQPFKDNPSKSKSWNRGAYIVNGPGHCVACHSPRNLFGARDISQDLTGNPEGPEGEKVPAINAASLTKNNWTKEDIVFALRTGSAPDGDALGGSMGEVIRESTAWLTDEDLKAIADYLLDKS